ncbi:enoyl-CoA hydratase [Mycobacteroides immunogenum]|uniref:Enoyl-CoA hydratase n=1 Tax=Mycobacteroides immunogenum TaxID=83262 RepID=A0A179V2W1_9MYCO|nr:enoyl-CoA hydratase [Mycobacteroides immunogenum]OAT66288.1 enoyl-CoA hydratase [Mycobacteroides immunogenum]
MTEPILLTQTEDRICTITLNRPQARNALSTALGEEIVKAVTAADADENIDVMILTAADPVFCAGVDLKELGSGDRAESLDPWWPELNKPVIGAINGAAVTGGLELALACDILIASEKARFADTHARVGILPTWGLTTLLPLSVGRGLARRMSLTGDYLSAEDALRAGLVTEVVAHDDLLPAAKRLAATIAGNNQPAVRELLASYRRIESELIGDGLQVALDDAHRWIDQNSIAEGVEARRAAIMERGRTQNA